MFPHHPHRKFGAKLIFVPLFLLVLFFNSCKKSEFVKPAGIQGTGNLTMHSRNSNDIEGWLGDKQVEFSEAGSVLIERMLPLLRMDDKYSEPYGSDGIENFIVVPIDFSSELSEHIRTDLSEPLQYLLIVSDSSGEIRRGDLIMFYPDSSISEMPANAFNQYFTTQTLPVDGTFQVVSLNNIKQYEMDIENSNPEEFRLWEGRHAVFDEDVIICIDWYLVTTYYYSNGTTEVFEEFLYTQCYGGSGGGGGGNGTTPPVQNHYPVTRNVSFIVAQQLPYGTLEHWTMEADYILTGECFPNNPSSNYFTAAPVSSGNTSSSVMLWGNNMHTVPWHTWYITFSFNSNTTGLSNNNKNAWANFRATLSYPNQPSMPPKVCFKPWNWSASAVLF